MLKSTLFAVVASLAIACASVASAQTVSVDTGQAGAGITFTLKEQKVVREWVKRQRSVPARAGIAVGVVLPDNVESYPVPEDWGPSAAEYRYFHSGEKVYFLDPSTRKVVYVFE